VYPRANDHAIARDFYVGLQAKCSLEMLLAVWSWPLQPAMLCIAVLLVTNQTVRFQVTERVQRRQRR
jgi:hypothetical protein